MANFNFNKVIPGGRLTADPELRQNPSGVPVTSFSIAVNRRYSKNSSQPQADFFNVVAWRANAEFISRYFRKGNSICIVGTIQNNNWTDQQGQKRYTTEIIVDEAHFVDSKGDVSPESARQSSGTQYTPDSYSAPGYSSDASNAPRFEDMSNDDDLPF